jgi:PIN domain nuclease of toxin-antitoxin system
MIGAVADTHVAVWYIFGDARLSRTALDFIEDCVERGARVGVSAISLVEVVYLIEKRRLPGPTLTRMLKALREADGVLQEIPLDSAIAEHVPRLPRHDVPDFPDRIIAATALRLDVPIISRDRKIRAAGLKTVW